MPTYVDKGMVVYSARVMHAVKIDTTTYCGPNDQKTTKTMLPSTIQQFEVDMHM